jgi:hypothetical protein
MSSSIVLLVLCSIHSARAADVTGDRIDDLLVGIPTEDVDGLTDAGAMEVIRGSTSGLTSTGDAFLHQGTTGVTGINSDDDGFGYAIGAGDVDGDGTTDVIVGGPDESPRGARCGAIWRLELAPTRSSLAVTASQELTPATTGVSAMCDEGDGFGRTLVVADFDGDGYDDVVVGIPNDDVGSVVDAGSVQYLRGGLGGFTTSGELYYDQAVLGVSGSADADDEFGAALAAGDFDADGYADVAIGIPGEDWTGSDEGGVHVMYGTTSGPGVTSPDDEIWTAGRAGAAGTLTDYAACGTALAVGDFDDDGYDDLAIGCPYDTVDAGMFAGSVLIVYGSAGGLDDSQVWTQATAGVPDVPEEMDQFGGALTSGDYDGDGYDDLAIGVGGESRSVFIQSGIVQVLPGSADGLTDVDDVVLEQDTSSIVLGTPADFGYFGVSLATGDYDGDGLDDLAVGVPRDADGGASFAGVVNVFYGSVSGPSTTGDMMFHQNSSGIEDTSEPNDAFGYSLR